MLSSMNEGIYVVLKLKGLRMPRVLNLYLFGICNISINNGCIPINITLIVTYLPTRSFIPAAYTGISAALSGCTAYATLLRPDSMGM